MPYDKLSYSLAHIKLAVKQKRLQVIIPNTQLIQKILILLARLGYINSYSLLDARRINIFLKYTENGSPAIQSIARVSRPGARVFISYATLKHKASRLNNLNNTFQTVIISTSKGVMSHQSAIIKKLGGEVLLVLN